QQAIRRGSLSLREKAGGLNEFVMHLKKLAKSIILRFINPEPRLTITPDGLLGPLLMHTGSVARACLAAVLLIGSVAFPADFNLPSAPSLSLARGSNSSTVTYRGQ